MLENINERALFIGREATKLILWSGALHSVQTSSFKQGTISFCQAAAVGAAFTRYCIALHHFYGNKDGLSVYYFYLILLERIPGYLPSVSGPRLPMGYAPPPSRFM